MPNRAATTHSRELIVLDVNSWPMISRSNLATSATSAIANSSGSASTACSAPARHPSPPPPAASSEPRDPASHLPASRAAASSQTEAPSEPRRRPPCRAPRPHPAGLRTAARTSTAVSCTAAVPSIGVESRICSAGPDNNPNSLASSIERSNTSRSLPCSNSRARKRTRARGVKPRMSTGRSSAIVQRKSNRTACIARSPDRPSR